MIRSRARQLLSTAFALAIAAGLASAARPVQADITTCLEDQNGNRLRRVWVEHPNGAQLTNAQGCLTIPTRELVLDVTVHARNPVVRILDGSTFAMPVTQRVRIRSGQSTAAIRAQSDWFALAEELRRIYEESFSDFAPWSGAEFPNGTAFASNDIISVAWPEWLVAQLAYVEPKAIGTDMPLVHFTAENASEHDTLAHELGHALHFGMLSAQTRERIQNEYIAFLATDALKTHCFERRTVPLLAYVEAFGFFGEMWDATAGSSDREADFFAAAAAAGARLTSPDPRCEDRESGPMHGDDVEGAVFMTLFHDFAQNPEVGLARVVETVATCEAVNVQEYATCVRNRFGATSPVFLALVEAGSHYGISFAAANPVQGVAEGWDQFGRTVAVGDFDGDGFDDLAIGVPHEDVGSQADAGAVNVIYASSFTARQLLTGPIGSFPTRLGGLLQAPVLRGFGLAAPRNQIWDQNSPGVPGTATAGDRFGAALAAADFNGDGYDDLAIGAPGEDVAGLDDAGYVVVLYGSPTGLQTASPAAQSWHQRSANIEGAAEAGDLFGSALAAGDFDGDGFADLAIGVPGEDKDLLSMDHGCVNVIYGTATGLAAARDQIWTQDSAGIADVLEGGDQFGFALTVGDFNGDGRDDLAIGVPFEDQDLFTHDTGVVHVLYGSPTGLTATGSQLWHQDSANISGVREAGDQFGRALAAGDFNGDGFDDLAIGVPFEDIGSPWDAGSVNVIYGSPNRLTSTGNQGWHQDVSGIVGGSEAFDNFGASLAVGDFDGDGFDDLAVGVPGEDLSGMFDVGAVNVIYGSANRLTAARNQMWHQDALAGTPWWWDGFGTSLAAGDFDGDGAADLAVGVPGEDVDFQLDAGAVNVIYGVRGTGLDDPRNQYWHQNR